MPRHPPDALLTLDLSIPIPSRKHAPTDTKARTPLGWITHIHRPQNTPTPPAHAARGKIPKRPGRPSAIRTLQSPTACHARQTATSPVRTKGYTHRVCPPVDDQPLHHVQYRESGTRSRDPGGFLVRPPQRPTPIALNSIPVSGARGREPGVGSQEPGRSRHQSPLTLNRPLLPPTPSWFPDPDTWHLTTRAARGGARRDRTDDLLLAKQALSQLSYGPFREPGVRNREPGGSCRSSPLQIPHCAHHDAVADPSSHPGSCFPDPVLCLPHHARKRVVGQGGLEPPTSPLSGVRSNHLSY